MPRLCHTGPSSASLAASAGVSEADFEKPSSMDATFAIAYRRYTLSVLWSVIFMATERETPARSMLPTADRLRS